MLFPLFMKMCLKIRLQICFSTGYRLMCLLKSYIELSEFTTMKLAVMIGIEDLILNWLQLI